MLCRNFAWRSGRQIVFSISSDLKVNDGVIDEKFTQRHLLVQSRNDSQADGEFVGAKQGRLIGAFGTVHRDVVQVSRQCPEIEVESPDFDLAASCGVGLINDFVDGEALKAIRLQIQVSADRCDDQESGESCQRPSDNAFPFHDVLKRPAQPLCSTAWD